MSDVAPHWRSSMSPREYLRVAEMRKKMLANLAPRGPEAVVTVGEPMIGQGDVQVAVGEPVIEQPHRPVLSPQQQAILKEMLRRKAAEAHPPQGALASLYGDGQ